VITNRKTRRSPQVMERLIAFSISYEEPNLLARGLGLEHLRELLTRLVRPIVRRGASLAYGGDWKEEEDNFTYELLNLISAEQEDNSMGGPDTNRQIGILYNHTSWPHYLKISRRIEAQWINACRIVRVSQQQAEVLPADTASDEEAPDKTDKAIFAAAVTLSAMRRKMMKGMSIDVPDVPNPERVPPVSARIMLGGRVTSFSGFLPGLFEEALVSLKSNCPLYILGGFGGAAEALTKPILNNVGRPGEFTSPWLVERNEKLARLHRAAAAFTMPPGLPTTDAALESLFDLLSSARAAPAKVLATGLEDDETRELMQTRNIATAVRLVRKGLIKTGNLPPDP
jgi:SLOG cluster2